MKKTTKQQIQDNFDLFKKLKAQEGKQEFWDIVEEEIAKGNLDKNRIIRGY